MMQRCILLVLLAGWVFGQTDIVPSIVLQMVKEDVVFLERHVTWVYTHDLFNETQRILTTPCRPDQYDCEQIDRVVKISKAISELQGAIIQSYLPKKKRIPNQIISKMKCKGDLCVRVDNIGRKRRATQPEAYAKLENFTAHLNEHISVRDGSLSSLSSLADLDAQRDENSFVRNEHDHIKKNLMREMTNNDILISTNLMLIKDLSAIVLAENGLLPKLWISPEVITEKLLAIQETLQKPLTIALPKGRNVSYFYSSKIVSKVEYSNTQVKLYISIPIKRNDFTYKIYRPILVPGSIGTDTTCKLNISEGLVVKNAQSGEYVTSDEMFLKNCIANHECVASKAYFSPHPDAMCLSNEQKCGVICKDEPSASVVSFVDKHTTVYVSGKHVVQLEFRNGTKMNIASTNHLGSTKFRFNCGTSLRVGSIKVTSKLDVYCDEATTRYTTRHIIPHCILSKMRGWNNKDNVLLHIWNPLYTFHNNFIDYIYEVVCTFFLKISIVTWFKLVYQFLIFTCTYSVMRYWSKKPERKFPRRS